MINSIKILLWNANGIQKQKKELELLLNSQSIDICLISETHLTSQSYFSIPLYETYHTIHPMNCARGGSAIIVRSSIKHHEETKISSNEFQTTTISIEVNGSPLKLTALYSPPRHNIKCDLYEQLFSQIGERFIIGGDFNAKHTHWGSRLISPKGRELLTAANNKGCKFLSTFKPTYWPTDKQKVPDLIDFFVIRKFSPNFLHITDGHDLSSDHSPVYLTISNTIAEKDLPAKLYNKHTNWTHFQQLLMLENFDKPVSTREIDECTECLTKSIQNAAWNSTPNLLKTAIGKSYPKEIKLMVIEKRKLRRKWQHSRNPILKTLLNKATKELNRAIKELENNSLGKYLSELSNDESTNYSLWKVTKKSKQQTTQSFPIKMENGHWAKTNEQKAEVFSDHLMKTFQPFESTHSTDLNDTTNILDENIPSCTILEVFTIITNLQLKKAPGFDLITAEILQNLPSNIIFFITDLLNACIRFKYVPVTWKVAEVIMIGKPGKPQNEITSYRPISLLPILSKVLEKLFLTRLMPIITSQHLIPNHQFGFRKQHSTLDQIHRITNVVETAFEHHKVCSAVFLDVSQAFDKVWHEGLLYKLRRHLPKSFCDFLTSYMSERFFRVKQTDTYSTLKAINAGVPQGSILGPILYLLFTSDIPTSPNCFIATFADDTALLATGKSTLETTEALQTALNMLITWTQIWRIKLNNLKSVHINFTLKKTTQYPLYIDGTVIPYSDSAKYLGMTLDAKLRWKEHVKKKKEELDIKLSKLYWLLGRRSKLSTYNKILIYKQVLKSVWTYGIQLWGCTSQNNINIIQRFQNKALRCIMNVPWYIRNSDLQRDIGIEPVNSVINSYATTHMLRLSTHPNEEASSLANVAETTRRLRRTRTRDLALNP